MYCHFDEQGGLMDKYLKSSHFPASSAQEDEALSSALDSILSADFRQNAFASLARYQRILADNSRKHEWPEIHKKLEVLFKCGIAAPLNGPMIGIPVSIRDSDCFKQAAELAGENRSAIAGLEVMGTAWNASFADTGLWMGKTYEPISKEQVAELSGNDPVLTASYKSDVTRIGRNYFREPPNPNALQGIGLPAITKFWHLLDRPTSEEADGFIGEIKQENIEKEKAIPYTKTGGYFLADMGRSVVPEMKEKSVYQLNYRWQNLKPVFPMTLLVDEIVQVAEGVYLGQLVYATKHFNLGTLDLPFIPGDQDITLGEVYKPREEPSWWEKILSRLFGREIRDTVDYGYQNNGYFLMMDPSYAKQIYADNAFPQLRPRHDEMGWDELGYDEFYKDKFGSPGYEDINWKEGWQSHPALKEKFTQFISEPSTNESDSLDLTTLRKEDESVLQMLQRLSKDISAQTKFEDHIQHFEVLNQLFRQGVAPRVENGVFRGKGENSFNADFNSPKSRDWYGVSEPIRGFNYYHGATLNLHWGFKDRFKAEDLDDSMLFPSVLASLVENPKLAGPNVLNMLWSSIGKYVFPWAGKSFEKVSGRKLSMLLDESDDLAKRYPERVKQIESFLASAPYATAIKKNKNHYWPDPGFYASHLENGSWDQGMSDEDKAFWENEAQNHWVYGNNLQDERILAMDAIMRIADMNYGSPDSNIQTLVNSGPSPFVRQGYCFLGAADQPSILEMNNSEKATKNVFQFNYRYPMMGGPIPINYCLDEIVEIADGLFLGQLIYSTALEQSYHSTADIDQYEYQLFGYFLMLDNDWEQHRQAIKLDTWREKKSDNKFTDILSQFS